MADAYTMCPATHSASIARAGTGRTLVRATATNAHRTARYVDKVHASYVHNNISMIKPSTTALSVCPLA